MILVVFFLYGIALGIVIRKLDHFHGHNKEDCIVDPCQTMKYVFGKLEKSSEEQILVLGNLTVVEELLFFESTYPLKLIGDDAKNPPQMQFQGQGKIEIKTQQQSTMTRFHVTDTREKVENDDTLLEFENGVVKDCHFDGIKSKVRFETISNCLLTNLNCVNTMKKEILFDQVTLVEHSTFQDMTFCSFSDVEIKFTDFKGQIEGILITGHTRFSSCNFFSDIEFHDEQLINIFGDAIVDIYDCEFAATSPTYDYFFMNGGALNIQLGTHFSNMSGTHGLLKCYEGQISLSDDVIFSPDLKKDQMSCVSDKCRLDNAQCAEWFNKNGTIGDGETEKKGLSVLTIVVIVLGSVVFVICACLCVVGVMGACLCLWEVVRRMKRKKGYENLDMPQSNNNEVKMNEQLIE